MVGALSQLGLNARGIEVSKTQVEFGNMMLGRDLLEFVDISDVKTYIDNIPQTGEYVLSFIGVLEHLGNMRNILSAVSSNTSIKYVFFSVPLYSLTCIFEMIFHDVFNLQLGGGHTHLFTMNSVEWMCKYYNWNPLAQWIFGSDIMDLYRSITVKLKKSEVSNQIIQEVSNFFIQHADELQSVIDKSGFTSELHMLVANRGFCK